MNKKNIFLWALYDFANSITTIVFFLYFSQWLVIDNGVSDFWYNMIFTIGSAILLLTAPVLGRIADRNGEQQKYLSLITVLTFLSFVGVSLVTLFLSHQVFLAALFFIVATYFYQFSFVFYNALLSYLAPAKLWGRISGIGQAGNWLGQIAGLAITLPLASGAIYLVGEVGRAQTFLPATILFFILSLPMLLYLKISRQKINHEKIILKEEYKNYWSQFKELVKSPGMGLFLLAFFFFNDAILTATNNFPIYLDRVFNIPDKTKSLLLLGILITSALGALCAGWIADKIGFKRTLMIILGVWVIVFPAMGLITDFKFFLLSAILMGFMYGATWAVTRAVMTVLCPKDRLNFGFSFYTLAERISTLVGPLSWGLITWLFIGLGPTRYRIAIISMGVFVVVSILILRKVEIKEATVIS